MRGRVLCRPQRRMSLINFGNIQLGFILNVCSLALIGQAQDLPLQITSNYRFKVEFYYEKFFYITFIVGDIRSNTRFRSNAEDG